MPRYHCTNCDHFFDHRGGRLRCPKCMRQNGLEELSETHRRQGGRASLKRLALLFGVLFCVTALVFVVARLVRQHRGVPRPGELALLDAPTLVGALAERGIPPEGAVNAFAAGAALVKLAGPASRGEPKKRAQAIAKRLAGKLVGLRVDLMGSANEPVRTATELAHALDTGRANSALSYELAVMLVAALRHGGLVALLCEAFEQRAPVRAADPSGLLGRYAAAVYASAESLAGKPLLVLDPARAAQLPAWAGGGGDGAMTSVLVNPRPLDDVSAAARLYALRALRQIEREPRSPEKAYELVQWAIDAAAPSATLRAARALVLAKAGGIEDAAAEAKRALRQRADPARRTVLAGLLLAQRRSKEAELQLRQAIEQDDSFWPAQRSLAALRWMAGDRSGGDLHLEQAKKLAPDEPSVIALVANQKLSSGETEQALALLRGLAQRQPSEQILLQLYIALLQSGEKEEVSAVRERLLQISADEERTRELLDGVEQGVAAEAAAREQAEQQPSTPPGTPSKAGAPQRLELPDVSLTPKPGLPGQNLR